VRPVRAPAECAEGGRLMDTHHHLGFRHLVGGGVHNVTQDVDGRWLALLGWKAGSFKVAARDRWIGWTPEQQFRRLRLVANNTRFLILPGVRIPNLASRSLSLSLRRLSGDMQAARGHPVLVAETFVDPERYRGTCYLAANWTEVGRTRGYARRNGRWDEHGRSKLVFVRAVVPGARSALAGPEDPAPLTPAPVADPPGPKRLRNLFEFLLGMPEYRHARGVRHSLPTVLTVAVAATFAGARGPTEIAEFASRLTQKHLAAVRAFRSPSRGRLVAPSKSSIHRILSQLDADVLERTVRDFNASRRHSGGGPVPGGRSTPTVRADGRDSTQEHVAAVAHRTGVVLGRIPSAGTDGEIRDVRRLLQELGVAGRIIMFDALCAFPRTARLIVDGGGDYVMPVREGNRLAPHEEPSMLDWDGAPSRRTLDRRDGRIMECVCSVVPLDDGSGEVAALPGRRQAFRVVRTRTCLTTGRTAPPETAYGLTSLVALRAGPSELLALDRGHREIGNRVHRGRDFGHHENRSRVLTGPIPINFARLSGATISMVSVRGRLQCQASARRQQVAGQDETLLEALEPNL